MRLAGIGIVLGLAGAYGVTRLLASLLFGVKATDPVTFGGVAALVALVALAATFAPAHRAAAIAPSDALRHQLRLPLESLIFLDEHSAHGSPLSIWIGVP